MVKKPSHATVPSSVGFFKIIILVVKPRILCSHHNQLAMCATLSTVEDALECRRCYRRILSSCCSQAPTTRWWSWVSTTGARSTTTPAQRWTPSRARTSQSPSPGRGKFTKLNPERLESTATKIPFMYSFSGNCVACPNFHTHVSVSDLYIPGIGPNISCRRIGADP